MSSKSIYSIKEFAEEFEAVASSENSFDQLVEEGQVVLRKLLPNLEILGGFLGEILRAEHLPEQLFRTVDKNDFTLYRSPKGNFSLRLYVWEPDTIFRTHDHGSWGVLGAYVNDVLVVTYSREDDGKVEGYAKLREKGRCVLKPGETSGVLPLNQGIHRTQSNDNRVALSIHAYGRPIRKGYINGFDLEHNKVHKLCTPRLDKSLLAIKALGALGGESSQTALEGGLRNAYPLVRWESLLTLKWLAPGSASSLMRKALEDESPEVRHRARALMEKSGD